MYKKRVNKIQKFLIIFKKINFYRCSIFLIYPPENEFCSNYKMAPQLKDSVPQRHKIKAQPQRFETPYPPLKRALGFFGLFSKGWMSYRKLADHSPGVLLENSLTVVTNKVV
jgi:hypothetical protein